MENGAFSDDRVVEAAKKILPVLVDCDWGRKNTDISGKYGARGYPTVLFTDPDGKVVERMGDRSAETIAGQLKSLAEKYVKKAAWQEYDAATFRDAAENKKPVLVFFTSEDKRSEAQEAAFTDKVVEEDLKKFVLIRHKIDKKCETCKKHRVYRGPAIHFLDPLDDDPSKTPLYRVTSKRSAKQLKSLFKSVLSKWARVLKEHEAKKP